MSRTECTDSNTAQNPETNYWSHTQKCTLQVGESICVNQAATISAALPAPPGPRDALCVKAHTRIEPVCVPVQSGESDAGINLTKKSKCILKKNLQGYFETLSFPQSSFSCSPANLCCETEEGAEASREEWEPSLHWWAVRAWGFRAAPASSGQGLHGPSHAQVCAAVPPFNWSWISLHGLWVQQAELAENKLISLPAATMSC